MSYVDALEGKVLAIRKIEADYNSIKLHRPRDISLLHKQLELERHILEIADCYYFDPEMIKIITHVAKDLPSNIPMSKTWFTSHIGWYWLGENSHLIGYVTRKSSRGELLEVRERICAFLYHWDNIDNALFFAAYTKDHMEPTSGPVLVFAAGWKEGDTLNQFVDKLKAKENELGGFQASLDGTLSIAWSRTGIKAAQFFMAASLWMQQKIITIQKSPKVANRMIRRSSIKDSQVKIIVLRRREYIKEEENNKSNPIEWSCRWFVRGHWRNQFYKSEDVHRPIWIDPYIKGPEDKPLKDVPKTFAIVR